MQVSSASSQAFSLLPGNWKMLNRHSADSGSLEDFFCWALWERRLLLTDPFVTLTSDYNLACIILPQPSLHGIFECFSTLSLWNSRSQEKSALQHSFLNQIDWFYLDTWILISDIFNFFSPPAAFEDDAIAVPVSAAAATNHYWYVLMSVTFRW